MKNKKKKEKIDLCEICNEWPVEVVCHNCGLLACEDCVRKANPTMEDWNWGNCPECPGQIYYEL